MSGSNISVDDILDADRSKPGTKNVYLDNSSKLLFIKYLGR